MTAKHKDLVAQDQRLAEIIAAHVQAIEAGQSPDREELVNRNPDLASELNDFFADQDEFDRVMSPYRWPVPATQFFASSSAQESNSVESLGHHVGDYELIEEIARGGMGVVFKARNVRLDRIVALKMILAGHLATPADVQRFRIEAENAAQLDHPNIVPLFEVGEHEGQHYFAMRLIEGGCLAGQVTRFAHDPSAAVALLANVARAVHYAHQRGILHRDLKPANILLDTSGRPHVTDFGLSQAAGGRRCASLIERRSSAHPATWHPSRRSAIRS